MIEFNGTVSRTIYKHLIKKIFLLGIVEILLGVALFGIPFIFLFRDDLESTIIVVVINVFVLSVLVINCSIINEQIPLCIKIEEEKISGNYKNGYRMRNVGDVKKVVDYGVFYDIIFYFPNKWGNCVCQKDLIVKGTLEDFEKLFEGKIVRKIKNKK